jgi:glyoxylase-like metal-dependent hydrolase (beta-lactamase superfamily II)
VKTLLGAGAVLMGGLSLTLAQQPATIVDAVIQAAAETMGVKDLQSIQYSGTGSVFLLGQAASPGGPWPRFELAKYVASVNYAEPSMREETVRRDVEFPPRGGGAGPFNPATGQGGMRPIPGDVAQTTVRDGRTQAGAIPIWMTPHGFLKAAMTNRTLVTRRQYQGHAVQEVAFGVEGRTLSGYVNDAHLVERIGTTAANTLLGSMPVEVTFSNYKRYGGVMFPTRVVQSQGGHPVMALDVTDVQPNSGVARGVTAGTPRAPAPAEAAVTTQLEPIAAGVSFLTGGNPLSVLVEFSDHLVVIEAPQDDTRSVATIAALKKMMPAKPIRYVINTHHHFDHSGGLGGYVAEGIPILTHEKNKAYFEDIFRKRPALDDDRIARARPAAIIETVRDRRALSDGSMTLELHHLQGNLHADTLLVAYLPKQKLLIQADAFHPRPGAAPLPAPPRYTVNLVENIRRLKLDVERVVHVHGGVDPLATVVRAAGG